MSQTAAIATEADTILTVEADTTVCIATTATVSVEADSISPNNPGYYFTDAFREDFLRVTAMPDTTNYALFDEISRKKHGPINIYQMPYSLTGSSPNWHRMWINTAVLSGAFVSTLFVLELLPEDATAWNRASISQTPPFKRWYRNIFVRNPEWDHDKWYFNYLLHPYAGAVYFMSARSQGFNFYQSLLYSFCVSTIGWEFGIEAFMERPSYQDLFITPVIGSVFGEMFYKVKRHIVSHDYRLAGSPVLGNVVAFLVDPVNEVIGLFRGNNARKLHLGAERTGVSSSLMPALVNGHPGFTFSCKF